MAVTIWKGHLTFGLVSIPIKLYKAARAKKISFHHLSRSQGTRVRQSFVLPPERVEPSLPVVVPPEPVAPPTLHIAPAKVEPPIQPSFEPQPAAPADLVKGYEYEKGRYVTMEKEEFRQITPPTSTEMQILEFVQFAEIDPVFLESSYYVVPDRGGERPYALLFAALRKTGSVAIAQIAMHNREHVMVLRPGENGIISHTMFYADEVRKTDEFHADASLVTPKEMDLAVKLIEALKAKFEPDKFKDTYRQKLEAAIAAKLQGGEIVREPEAPKTGVPDILEALKKSLSLTRKPVKSATAPKKKQRRAG
jgi:DNA end-binding protein Ku